MYIYNLYMYCNGATLQKPDIRHQFFHISVRPSVRQAHGTPPVFLNGGDWRLLVNLSNPNKAKQRQ